MLPRSDLWNAWATRRDSRAFEALLLPELPHALRFARRLGCDPAEAEDAVQDALARLASIRQPFAVDGLRTWLCREVHTRARSRLRSERRRGRRQAMAAAPAESARTDTLIDDRDEVERLLDALPADERMAVELRYLHDLDYREMALVLRASEGACRQRVSRALATLRERIGRSAPALIAALPLEPARQGPALIHAALAETATVPLAAGGGMLVATTNSKLTVAALALAAGIAGTLGVQSGLDGSPRAGARTSASGPESRLLAERDREIADLRQQLTEAIRKPPGPPPSEKADGARTTAEPGGYAAVGDRWRKEILQLEDPARQAAAWAEVRAALRSDDPTTLCAGLWAVKFTSHCVYLDRTGLDAELVALLSGTAPLPRLLAWQALLQRDQVASASGGAPVLDAALREQLRRETAASPVAVRASMVQTLIGAHGGDVAGAAAETVLRLLADEQHRAETIRGLAGARTLSDPVGRNSWISPRRARSWPHR